MLTTKNPMIQKAVVKLQTLSEDERTRLLAESREKLQRDIYARERAAEEKGQAKERRAFARKLLARNRPIEEIIEDTGLSREEILSLLH